MFSFCWLLNLFKFLPSRPYPVFIYCAYKKFMLMTCIEHEKENILFGIVPCCSLLVIQKLWSLSMFQTIFLPHQHGRSALDTSRTLFLLASTQGVSCRLVMNHLPDIYVYVLSHPPPPPPPPIYLFSCPSVPAPQLLIFHREYLSWYIVVVYQS